MDGSVPKLNDEDIRMLLLVLLNGVDGGAATAETFNHQGKTDMLIRADGKDVFITESKVWSGAKAFLETLDQLLGYLRWRDSKTAILNVCKGHQYCNGSRSDFCCFSSILHSRSFYEAIQQRANFALELRAEMSQWFASVCHGSILRYPKS